MNPTFRLTLSIAVIVVLWQVPGGAQLLYPLTLLATLAHELGHGLTALLVGARFESLALYPDGSGIARWTGSPGAIGTALIAAGGLVGPSVAGVVLLCLSNWQRFVRRLLVLLALLAALVVVMWVRNPFGILFVLSAATVMIIASRVLADGAAAFLLNLVAVTLCLSLFKDIDYMFSEFAIVDGITRTSDSAAIAAALWLPYWFWGASVMVFSLALLILGVWMTNRSVRDTGKGAGEANSA